jgi:hypothetical protein
LIDGFFDRLERGGAVEGLERAEDQAELAEVALGDEGGGDAGEFLGGDVAVAPGVEFNRLAGG